MTMKLLTARRFPRTCVLSVHLDTTKMSGTDPDPRWVYTQTWTLPPRNEGETAGQYNTRIAPWIAGVRADFRENARARLAELNDADDPGTALPGEGQTLA